MFNDKALIKETLKWPEWRALFWSCLAVLLGLAFVELLEENTPTVFDKRNTKNIALVFLLINVFVSGYFGLVCGLMSSIASALIVNYLYTLPLYSFRIVDLPEQINLALFIAAALTVSIFTANLRAKARQVARREQRTKTLYDLNRRVAMADAFDQAIRYLQDEITNAMQAYAVIFLSDKEESDNLKPYHKNLTEKDSALAAKAWATQQMQTEDGCIAYPMRTPDTKIGVLFLSQSPQQHDPNWTMMLGVLIEQAALLVERLQLNQQTQESHVREEREKLRAMLLSSVSHDLKTPLASIIGSLSVYHSMHDKLTPEKRRTLTQTALDEAQRLDNFISNILDMTRLESGAVTFKKEWFNPVLTTEKQVKRLKMRLRSHPVTVHPPEAGFEIQADPTTTEQMLQNLLDNAAKYTPSGTPIEVYFKREEALAMIQVRDHGPGIPEEKRQAVFDKYERLRHQDSQVAGTGLGLAIARAVMQAQGGTITAANHPEGGAVFTLSFPQVREVKN